MAESEAEEEGESMNIARRTRSHLRIDDFVPDDNLNFPDVDISLYQNPSSSGDPEYRNFLNQTYSADLLTTDTNNDDNDPEYVYNDDIFSHGWRFDLNEVRELCQESEQETDENENLNQIDNNNVVLDDNQRLAVPVGDRGASRVLSPCKGARRKLDMFAEPEFANILNQQLRQHIQLLTQTYLLTKHTTHMRNEAQEAKNHLDSYMMIFKNKSKPSNLLPALDLINNLSAPKDLRSSIRLSWRPLPIPDTVNRLIKSNPNIFMYPSLKPQVAYSILPERLLPKKQKITFTHNEDKLLAYALNEFKGEATPYAFIASLLMTAKTKTQISNHIKNIKRSPGNEDNPIKLYYATGELPEIDLHRYKAVLDTKPKLESIDDADVEVKSVDTSVESDKSVNIEPEPVDETKLIECERTNITSEKSPPEQQQQQQQEANQEISQVDQSFYQESDELMNMNLDDLMAASTTITKTSIITTSNTHSENKNLRNMRLKKSMLDLMSNEFKLSDSMGNLIVYDFLKTAQSKLSERNHFHLLQLLTDLMKTGQKDGQRTPLVIYEEVSKYLSSVCAPPELCDKLILLLNLEQANKIGCSGIYLHWMRFFEFIHHVEMYHDNQEVFEKKLARLVDALQKDDQHKIKLAVANLINKHPLLKREFESLQLDAKPHESLFLNEEDFDDITEPISSADASACSHEHFVAGVDEVEASYATQSCPCKCHHSDTQHCESCNLKFMRGRIYLVNKIKPNLAEWTYTGKRKCIASAAAVAVQQAAAAHAATPCTWSMDEDREILEFCRQRADDCVSFDATTFEELAGKTAKRSAREIAERFNYLMELYSSKVRGDE